MNARLQSNLDALESALGTLTESITTYNPSVAAAQGVLAADAALGAGIEELVAHQRNHARLLELENTAAALEGQLRGALGDLAAARAEIQASGKGRTARPPPRSHRPVSPRALLDHAHNAAPFAAPVGFVPPAAAAPPDAQQVDGEHLPDADATDAATEDNLPRNPALAALEPGLRAWLDPITQIPFTPWPSNDMVARSGMARVQGWSGAVDPAAAAAEAAAAEQQGQGPTMATAVDQDQSQIGADGKTEEDREREVRARAAHAAQQHHRAEEKQQVFMGMELLGSDEE